MKCHWRRVRDGSLLSSKECVRCQNGLRVTYAGTEGWVLVFSKEVFYGTAAPIADAAGLKLDGCPEFAKEVQL
jgi:hypothetical protein